ncbi:hypothetical protein ROR02_04060 [Pararhodospirillum oryzae]|uniref:Uncharacterized protein n=1 Tax=Pararhodospirillum oryzae TaxID=478448 RepID=A0A512H484_9PROT|nr:hypothetical protein ROR02_04060 [Pararhodospirillum oryzae]
MGAKPVVEQSGGQDSVADAGCGNEKKGHARETGLEGRRKNGDFRASHGGGRGLLPVRIAGAGVSSHALRGLGLADGRAEVHIFQKQGGKEGARAGTPA